MIKQQIILGIVILLVICYGMVFFQKGISGKIYSVSGGKTSTYFIRRTNSENHKVVSYKHGPYTFDVETKKDGEKAIRIDNNEGEVKQYKIRYSAIQGSKHLYNIEIEEDSELILKGIYNQENNLYTVEGELGHTYSLVDKNVARNYVLIKLALGIEDIRGNLGGIVAIGILVCMMGLVHIVPELFRYKKETVISICCFCIIVFLIMAIWI